MRVFNLLIAVAFSFALSNLAFSGEGKLVKVESKRGVTQPFLFINPGNPKAGVVLFVGGDGLLKLSSSGKIRENENNFFSRTYGDFAKQGLMVALVDVPSDMEKSYAMFRIGKKHAEDIVAVIKHMKKQANVPIWLVGTSMGSFSAASTAIKKQKMVDGLVLTSSVTNPENEKELKKLSNKYPNGVTSLNLKKLKKPALIMGHAEDTCKVSPPKGAAELKAQLKNSSRVEVVLLKGGKARKSDVCHGLSKHGFYGIEKAAVKKIADFIKQ
jgi:dienelactone hydrolase